MSNVFFGTNMFTLVTFTPLTTDHALSQAVSDIDWTLLPFVNVIHFCQVTRHCSSSGIFVSQIATVGIMS